MSVLGIGDLASSLMARRNNSSLKHELARLSQELATGRVANVSEKTGGNSSSLSNLEHSLALIDAYSQAQIKIGQKFEFAETALDAVGEQISGLGPSILSKSASGGIAIEAILHGASGKFHGAIAAFSVRSGSAYVFSGDEPNAPPLAPSSEMLDRLEIVTSGAVTAADFYQRVDDWFNQPGGFDTFGYIGGAEASDGVPISATDSLEFDLTAEATEFRAVFRDLAVISLVEQNSFVGVEEERVALLNEAAAGLIAGETGLTEMRAKVGEKQELLEAAKTQNGFHQNSLSEMKNEIVGVDLFETAARFEEVQLQLESLYLATAKSARLSLTGYLR